MSQRGVKVLLRFYDIKKDRKRIERFYNNPDKYTILKETPYFSPEFSSLYLYMVIGEFTTAVNTEEDKTLSRDEERVNESVLNLNDNIEKEKERFIQRNNAIETDFITS